MQAIYLPPVVNFVICIIGLIYGIVAVISGFKKEKKSFLYLDGFGRYIKSPILNILYGMLLVVACIFGLLKYGGLL